MPQAMVQAIPPPPRAVWRACLVAATVFTHGACSLAFVDAPPPRAASMSYFDCTSSRLAPNTDATVAALLALATLGSASDPQASSETGGQLTGAALAAGMLLSAIHGWKVTADCRAAKDELAARLQNGGGPRLSPADPWWGNGTDLLPAPAPAPAPVPIPPLPPPSLTQPPNAAPEPPAPQGGSTPATAR